MGNVRLYGSTSGYTELAPPAVAPDGVLSLPSGVGTLLTAEGGKVLQVVRATDTTDRTTTSTSFIDSGLSVTITPRRSTSFIMLISVFLASKTVSDGCRFVITDNSNNFINGTNPIGGVLYSSSTSSISAMQTLIGYATPATTSATTYKLRFASSLGNAATLSNATNIAQLFAIEVSA